MTKMTSNWERKEKANVMGSREREGREREGADLEFAVGEQGSRRFRAFISWDEVPLFSPECFIVEVNLHPRIV